MSLTLNISQKKYKYLSIILASLIIALVLLPTISIAAQVFGGLVSVQNIGTSGTNDSQLVIGNTNSPNSWFDIGLASIEGVPNPYVNPDSPEYQLNALIPLVLMAMVIIMMVAFMARGDFGLVGLILVVVMLYMFYGMLPDIQAMITGLLGG